MTDTVATVAFLGPEGTFSEEAVVSDLAEGSYRPLPSPSIFEAVLAVQRRTADLSLVPLENSVAGPVNVTLDALIADAPDAEIVGEVILPIHHFLVAGKPLQLSEIETVVSHPQASGQCLGFLRSQLPEAQIAAASSTADAVRSVIESDRPIAAIGNRLAAEIYGGTVIAANIEDAGDNRTRFVWLANRSGQRSFPPRYREADSGKTSVAFWGSGAGQAGWLVHCLAAFAEQGVNLTKIESRPRRDQPWSYIFFLDAEGLANEPPVAKALAALSERAEHVRILGSYPVSN